MTLVAIPHEYEEEMIRADQSIHDENQYKYIYDGSKIIQLESDTDLEGSIPQQFQLVS